MSDWNLLFDDQQNFSCTSCGKCCRANWRVRVDPGIQAKIESLAAYQDLREEGYTPLVVVEDQLELARHPDTACLFLEEDKCNIHKEAGPRAKPSACRLFPFRVVSTEAGAFVSLDFSCPAVLEGDGDRAKLQSDDLKRTILDSPHLFPSPETSATRVTITQDHSICWEDYKIWETKLQENISSKCDPRQALRQGLSELLQIEDAGAFATAISEDWPYYATLTIAHLECYQNPSEIPMFMGQFMHGGIISSQLVNGDLPALQLLEIPDQVTDGVLQRYVANVIFGKQLITGPTLFSRMLYLLTGVEVYLYYLHALRSKDSEPNSAWDQLERCFVLIETEAQVQRGNLQPYFLEWEKDLVSRFNSL